LFEKLYVGILLREVVILLEISESQNLRGLNSNLEK